jgi:hypothetical protein
MSSILQRLLIVTTLLVAAMVGPCYSLVHARVPTIVPSIPGGVCTGAPEPQGLHENIRMHSLKAIMRLKPHSYTVDAVFGLHNPGEKTTAQIRFPNIGDTSYSPLADTPAFMRFDLWVNGRKTRGTEGQDRINSAKESLQKLVPSGWIGEPPEIARRLNSLLSPGILNWLFAEVTFPARAVTIVRLACEGTYFACYGGGKEASFVLETAGQWKGKIRNASFTLDCTEVGGVEHCDAKLYHYVPEWSVQTTKNTIRFEKANFHHFEGQPSISVSFR